MSIQESIPVGKVARAMQFAKAGVKVGGNYVKHYGRKIFDSDVTKEELHQANAADIYKSLSTLKGSALKVAQMMSMDKSLLPRAYTDRFAMAQYSAPPLSGPLVINTFKKGLGKGPSDLFDTFETNANNAASIGQVHKATKNGKTLAVKIQYPGVADSISSDLKMARPLAVSLLSLNDADIDRYFGEVETKLLEEADYKRELEQSIWLSEACKNMDGLYFPKYYRELSSDRIITMDWIDGLHLKEFLDTNPSQEIRNLIGQRLWDFFDFQFHTLKKVHADPHPGNFLMKADGSLGILDFGCIKEIPEEYYQNYFALISPKTMSDENSMRKIFEELEFILPEDSPSQRVFFSDIFKKMIALLGRPFMSETFDFSDNTYVDEIYGFLEYVSKLPELKSAKSARGSKHGLYVNRTYFGIYTLLSDLKATIKVSKPDWIK